MMIPVAERLSRFVAATNEKRENSNCACEFHTMFRYLTNVAFDCEY